MGLAGQGWLRGMRPNVSKLSIIIKGGTRKLGNCSRLKELRLENQMQYVIIDWILYWKRKKNTVKDLTDSIDVTGKQMVFWIKLLYL